MAALVGADLETLAFGASQRQPDAIAKPDAQPSGVTAQLVARTFSHFLLLLRSHDVELRSCEESCALACFGDELKLGKT